MTVNDFAPFVILEWVDDRWEIESEYGTYQDGIVWFRHLVNRGATVAFVDIEEVRNPT